MSAVLEALPPRAAIDGAVYIPINLLAPSATNPRKTFDPKRLEELAESVRKVGVLQPILVRPAPKAKPGQPVYEIVAGERRWRASKLADAIAVPALVREMTDFEVLELQVIENLQRDDLHPLEEAEGYEALMRKPDGISGFATADELAARIGKSRSYVFGRLKLCALIPAARKAFLDGKVNASTALLIARMPVPVQTEATKKIVDGWGGEPMSYRDARDYLQREFMLELSGAPFKITDETLHPSAGHCRACSKRTGANPGLFDDIKSGDVCTDASCFNVKRDTHQQRLIEQARAEGHEVITGAKAKKIMPYSHRVEGYLRLDEPDYRVNGTKPLGKLLGKDAPQIVLVESPHSHELVKVVREDEALKVLKDKGHIRSSRMPTTSDDQRKREAKAKAENAWRRAVAERTVAAVLDPAFDEDLVRRAWLMPEIGAAMFDRLEYETAKRVAQLLGWDEKLGRGYDGGTRAKVTAHFRQLTAAELEQAFVAMAIAGQIHVSTYGGDTKPERLVEFAGRYGVDAAAVRAELARKTKPKPKAAKSKPPKAKRPGGNRKVPAPKRPTVKYRNDETGETWSGRGLQPAWLKTALGAGRALSDFDTTEQAAGAQP